MIRRFSYCGIRRNEYVWKETVTTHCCDVNGIYDNFGYNSHSTLYIGFGGSIKRMQQMHAVYKNIFDRVY